VSGNPIDFLLYSEGRYDRHRLIPWWDQERLSKARLIVAGAGALGNETLKLLALLGVGNLTVIDYDTISPSNLSRMVLFRESDIGRSKSITAAERLREINPDIFVQAIHGDLRYDLGLGSYRQADLILGCLDSVEARWALNRRCQLAGVSWIDAGMSHFHGQVTRYSPSSGACYECTFTPTTYERFSKHYSCPYGLLNRQSEKIVPTTVVTASIIAALQVQEALYVLHNLDKTGLNPGQRLTVFLNPYHLTVDTLPFNPDCLAHESLPTSLPELHIHPNSKTIGEVIQQVGGEYIPGAHTLELPFDLLTFFSCPGCETQSTVMRPKDKVHQDEVICPRCGENRIPEFLSSIHLDATISGARWEALKLPPDEILTFSNSERSQPILIRQEVTNHG
jgi:molybdopterin/thiamine biosynthesis adenylyltransferase